MAYTNNNKLSNESNELLPIPQISSRNVRVLPKSEGLLCDNKDGFVVSGVRYLLSEFVCSLKLDLDHSVSEATVR